MISADVPMDEKGSTLIILLVPKEAEAQPSDEPASHLVA
jgi:hypothetical protein